MITFILNNKLIQTESHPGTTLLDFIRYDENLTGTKIGCREGDCGACTVLEGTLDNNKVIYKSIASCLTPLGNAQGKHIVSIEGINMKELSPVQNAMVNNAGTQCGFCTPGFIMSFTAHSLSTEPSDNELTIAAISGNICRCTGYKSIEKAAEDISELLKIKDISDPIKWLVENKHIPNYFLEIKNRLEKLEGLNVEKSENDKIIAGGTDLMVQIPEEIAESDIHLFYNQKDLKGIKKDKDSIIIGSASNASEIMNSEVMQEYFPEIKSHFKLISSEPIRNMGTIAGNFVNASPIGDLSIFFLALNVNIILKESKNTRQILLKDFFINYKKIDLNKGEYIESVIIPMPYQKLLFNFEKVSKRTHLDIASVNSAIFLKMKDNIIENCSVSAGGVSAIPKYLSKTSEFLIGKTITNEVVIKANKILQEEISPISDVRGSAEYKRLLLRQLFFAHFIKLYPESISLKELLS
ncbi:MAG: 2Fe-2S iron-sulfur cluster binding domain-containing protein [Bacteroidales bacterium]|nr:2Fe-2S iron-sulfur cluster binding domain-containing protein [Bacteroidales bacterium]